MLSGRQRPWRGSSVVSSVGSHERCDLHHQGGSDVGALRLVVVVAVMAGIAGCSSGSGAAYVARIFGWSCSRRFLRWHDGPDRNPVPKWPTWLRYSRLSSIAGCKATQMLWRFCRYEGSRGLRRRNSEHEPEAIAAENRPACPAPCCPLSPGCRGGGSRCCQASLAVCRPTSA